MTAQGPRKGEPSGMFYAAGFRTPPARLVRGSSRRIMTMRLRPANIRVINRRDSSWAVLGPAVPNRCSTLTSRNVFPPPPPVEVSVDARNGARPQGFASPRQKRARPGSLRAVPARPILRRAAPAGTILDVLHQNKKPAVLTGLDRVAPYQNNSFRLNCVCRA
jgi:hypothetical protein